MSRLVEHKEIRSFRNYCEVTNAELLYKVRKKIWWNSSNTCNSIDGPVIDESLGMMNYPIRKLEGCLLVSAMNLTYIIRSHKNAIKALPDLLIALIKLETRATRSQ